MSISLFSVAILLIVLTVAAIEIYRGMVRGFFPTLISLGLMVPSAITAFLLASALGQVTTSIIMNNILLPNGYYQALAQYFTATDMLAQAGIQLIANILLFVLLFLLLRPLFQFVCYCFTLDYLAASNVDPGYHREKNSFCYRNNKLLGGITGGVSAIIISMVITCPFMGALRVADDVIDMAEALEPRLWSMTTLTEEEVQAIRDLPEDLPGNVLYELGGKYLFDAAAKTQINGKTVYLHEELATVKSLFSRIQDAMPILENLENATPEQLDQLRGLRDDLNKIQVVHGLAVDYFVYCAKAWLQDATYFNLVQPKTPSMMQPMMDEILRVCTTSDFNTAQANATTLINCYILLLENEVASTASKHYKETILLLDSTQLLPKLEEELAKNPAMAHIRTSSVGVQIWGDIVRSSNFYSYRNDFYEALANALNVIEHRNYSNVEDRIAVLNTYLNKALEKSPVEIPQFLRDALATELIYLSPINDDFTVQDMKLFFNKFA